MHQIVMKDRRGIVTPLPIKYKSKKLADAAVKFMAIKHYSSDCQFNFTDGLAVIGYPDGTQCEYWRSSEEVLQHSLPIF